MLKQLSVCLLKTQITSCQTESTPLAHVIMDFSHTSLWSMEYLPTHAPVFQLLILLKSPTAKTSKVHSAVQITLPLMKVQLLKHHLVAAIQIILLLEITSLNHCSA